MKLYIILAAFVVPALTLLIVDCIGKRMAIPHLSDVEVITGDFKGRRGKVCSFPWFGNLWHMWIDLNVPMDHKKAEAVYGESYGPKGMKDMHLEIDFGLGPRDFVNVGCNEVRVVRRDPIEDVIGSRERVDRFFEAKYP